MTLSIWLGSLLLVCFQINYSITTASYFAAGLSMLMLLVGILFLANMAQTGRPSYEEILIKAKNNQLSAPDDPSVKFAGQYRLFINVTIGCQNVAFVNFPNCHEVGLFLFCYEHSELLVWHKRSQMSLLFGLIHFKFLIIDILFIVLFLSFLWFLQINMQPCT